MRLFRSLMARGLLVSFVACTPSAKSPPSPDAPHAVVESSGPAPAIPTPAAALLVLAKRDRTLAIVDPGSLRVLAKVPVGEDPHEVIASSDGKIAYVSNYGHGALHSLAVVDLVHQTALPSIDLAALRGPHGLAFMGNKVWFTAEAAKAIGRLDPATGKVDWIMGTGQNRTHMIYVAKDMTWIATSNVESGTVSILDARAAPPPAPAPSAPSGAPSSAPSAAPPPGPAAPDWSETVIPVGGGSEGFDVSPDGTELWVANAREGTVSVIEVATRKVIQTIAANVVGANRLKFTSNGHFVLISSVRGPEIVIFDVAARKEAKRLPVGHAASGILVQPNADRAFVACSPDNNIAVIDLKTLEVTGRIDVGREPDGMAWATRP
jgi:YVTN family beta-propeller protein